VGAQTSAEGVERTAAAPQAPQANEPDLVSLAAEVEQGTLTPAQAVEQVVARVLDAQLPADASSVARERVRALVEASLKDDPLLRSLVERLGGDQ